MSTLERMVWQYIDKELNIRHDELGGMAVCPFAKRYRSQIKVTVARQSITEILPYACRTWNSEDVCWVYAMPWDTVPNIHLTEEFCDQWYDRFRARGATLLLDDPRHKEPVAGVYTGFGKAPLIIVQDTKTLQHARNKLFKTRYYENWNDEEKRELVD